MRFIIRSILICLFCLFTGAMVHAQTSNAPNYYVVIGAFSKIDNAVRFTDMANKKNFTTQYAINPERGLYYVYILGTTERRKAFSFMLKIRLETEYKDAWVFIGQLGNEEPVVELPAEEAKPEPETPAVELPAEPIIQEPVVEPEPTPVTTPEVKKPEGKPFLFKLVNGESGSEVRGQVHLLESSKASQYQAFNANEIVYVGPPRNTAGDYLVVVQAPGYKEAKVLVNYKDPSAVSSGTGSDDEVVIPVELVRSRKGDYIEFNNVRFYRNSAIFVPEARDEMDGLVDLMKEQTKYKIRIHAHCNGKDARDIVSVGDSKDYFATNGMNAKSRGSAKQLTELRADLVKRYLVENGISAKRIKTKAEGGNAMIYPANSTLANYNDRVEIEVTKGR